MKPRLLARIRLSLLLTLITILCLSFADEDNRIRRIKDALYRFTILYPQQKAYLHIDKERYIAGETIWIKAYLVSGVNHFPDTLSTNLYVELYGPGKQQIQIKQFQMFNGFGFGDFTLSDTLPEGLYQIRAYTNWMQNFDASYFFSKNFQITNPGYIKLISPLQAHKNTKEIDQREKESEDIDIQFLPEGGSLVYGLESTVAFKAINKLGEGVNIAGEIYDSENTKVNDFNSYHRGMGTFRLIPEKDKKYYALIRYKDEKMRVMLPEPLAYGVVMHIKSDQGNINVDLLSNRPQTNDRMANEVTVVGQVRGRMFYYSIVNLETGQSTLSIPKNTFPTGIVQFTAFSYRNEPLAERLVFVNHRDQIKIKMNVSNVVIEDHNKIAVQIMTLNSRQQPVQANLSLSVTRVKNDKSPISDENIVSNLLLSSDLKGYIEDPAYYFNTLSDSAQIALDNLLLTQGWRRFNWTNILSGNFPKIHYLEEKGITIEGQITRDFFGVPIHNSKVQLSILDQYNDVFSQQSDVRGYFKFDKMVYYDTIKAKIEAWKPTGKRNLVIVLPDNQFKEVKQYTGDFTLTTLSERDQKAYRRMKSVKERLAYNEEQEQLEKERTEHFHSIHGEPDAIIRSKDITPGTTDAIEALQGKVPGVMVNHDNVIIRGPSSLLGNNQPLYLIDDIPTEDVDLVKSIPAEDIDRIEILKGPSASIYGVRGANGVIAIYTKRGHFMKRGELEFEMLGYSTPRQFYQPKYTVDNEPDNTYTVFWNPLIKTNIEGSAYVLFDTPDIHANYRFVLEGITYDGQMGYVNEVAYYE